MSEQPTPDEVFESYSEPVGLEIRLVKEEDSDGSFLLVSGDREALRFLAAVLTALSASPQLPASKQFGHGVGGWFHLSPSSNIPVYLECTSDDAKVRLES